MPKPMIYQINVRIPNKSEIINIQFNSFDNFILKFKYDSNYIKVDTLAYISELESDSLYIYSINALNSFSFVNIPTNIWITDYPRFLELELLINSKKIKIGMLLNNDNSVDEINFRKVLKYLKHLSKNKIEIQ